MVLERLLSNVLKHVVRHGKLEFTTERGRVHVAGDGTAPHVAVRLLGRGATLALLRDPELTLGELFMDGRLVIEQGSLIELLQLLLQDSGGAHNALPIPAIARLHRLASRFGRANDPRRSQRNVAHHYDLSGALYELFLDRDRQYSCAYFEDDGQPLDEAQRAKERHVAAKLDIRPGQRVLDIGSGWGGLAAYLADCAGAGAVKGITLSREQLGAARQMAETRGLGARVSFELADYRSVTGSYDRIVSVGMFEHVSPRDYRAYFGAVSRLLKRDGVVLLHFIGRTGGPSYPNPWIRKYVFPGGHVATLSDVIPEIEHAGLAVTDVEVLRLHYAETLKAWRERFMAHREVAARLYDERFCRMWEFYLTMCEASFRWQDVVVFQIQLAKRNDVLPLTRDYIADREAALRRAEERGRPSLAAAE